MKYNIKINLLPYRKIENDQNKRKFILNIIISIIIGSFFSMSIFFILKLNYFNKTVKYNYLNNEINLLSNKLLIYKDKLNYNKRLKTERLSLEQLQVNRYKLYRMLNDLNFILPDRGIYLTNVNYSKDNVYIIKGKVINDGLLASFMKLIPTTGLFDKVNLSEIKSNNSKENSFTIIAFLANHNNNKIKKNKKIINKIN